MWQWQMATARFYLVRIETQLETQAFGSKMGYPTIPTDYQILSNIFIYYLGVFPI